MESDKLDVTACQICFDVLLYLACQINYAFSIFQLFTSFLKTYTANIDNIWSEKRMKGQHMVAYIWIINENESQIYCYKKPHRKFKFPYVCVVG